MKAAGEVAGMSSEHKLPSFQIHDPNPPERTAEAALRLLVELHLAKLRAAPPETQFKQASLPR